MDSTTITLNEVEQTFRQLLLDVVEFIENHPVSSSTTSAHVPVPEDLNKAPLQLRFTGGWVRDKLINVESQDIDVGINKMTGYQFGLRLKEYLDAPGNAAKYGLEGQAKKAGSLSKIEANPEKSKHLETVTTQILGLDIDLVNLRKETYTELSRNPQMEFGTPEEDASRRDATINSMFYNIHTGLVEDLTGRGLDDLRHGIIRTPLEPHTTFVDDPLRVLRLIRFASRYGFEIAPESSKAMGEEDIKKALMLKITRERVWNELEKMLKGSDPYTALEYIDDLKLYETIFVDPRHPDTFKPDLKNWPAVYTTVSEFASEKNETLSASITSRLIRNREEKFLSWISAAVIPLVDAPKLRPLKGGKPSPPFATIVAREGLKAPNKITDLITSSICNMDEIRDLKETGETGRDILGLAIRDWGPTFRQQIMFLILYEIFSAPESKEKILRSYDSFLARIQGYDLLEAYNLKPLIDGKTLAEAMSTPPGPWMKSALDVVMAWQLRNPESTDPKAAIAEVEAWKEGKVGVVHVDSAPPKKRRKQGELSSALTSHFLHLTLRPLFSQTPNPELTGTGRRNINNSLNQQAPAFLPDSSRPWRTHPWSLDLLGWVCRTIDPRNVQMEWGFLIPPVLTVLDDYDIKTKARGCNLLRLVLETTPAELLKRTGLAPVFEETLLTCTSYLPSITAEEDSVAILNAAFPALLTLSNTIFSPLDPPTYSPERSRFLTKVVRNGIFSGYKHAGENVRIAETLLGQLPDVLDALGIDSVKHLKVLVPLLSKLLDDPLGPAYPPLLLVVTNCMGAVIGNTWPRVPLWRAEILKGICGCWLNLSDYSGSGLDDIRRGCLELVEMLDAVMKADEGAAEWTRDLKSLSDADQRLTTLFEPLLTRETDTAEGESVKNNPRA